MVYVPSNWGQIAICGMRRSRNGGQTPRKRNITVPRPQKRKIGPSRKRTVPQLLSNNPKNKLKNKLKRAGAPAESRIHIQAPSAFAPALRWFVNFAVLNTWFHASGSAVRRVFQDKLL